MRSQNPSTLELSCCVALLVATARPFTAHRPLTVAALLRPKVNYVLEDQLRLDTPLELGRVSRQDALAWFLPIWQYGERAQ